MTRIGWWLTVAALLAAVPLPAADSAPVRVIPPGYVPGPTNLEVGLWLELEEYETAVRRSALRIRDSELEDYVQSVVCRMAGDYCGDLRVYMVRNPGFNASMNATGMMEVWTGLLVRLASEDELAAIVGHELAHYVRRHTLERFERISTGLAGSSVFDLGFALLTGVGLPVGQMAAVAGLMSFSREQETEADRMGVEFMERAGYDPGAAVRVWHKVLAENRAAVDKDREPGIFSKTHPGAEERIRALEAALEGRFQQERATAVDNQRHVAMLNRHYRELMEDQVDTSRHGRTEFILRMHEEIGVDESLVEFFRGELYRQRAQPGDFALALQSYQKAVDTEPSVDAAWRELGYLYLKEKRLAGARLAFQKYLDRVPAADDRAMIEYYLNEVPQ